jgi:CO/xanthine dehydrogenase FAD-binding subunit
MKLPPLSYLRPPTIADALDAWSGSGPDTMFLAGGQGLLSEMAQGLRRPATLIDISAIPECRAIETLPGAPVIRIGAAVRLTELTAHPKLAGSLLAAAARHVAVPPVRALATVGGNFCHGHPTSELPLAALVAGAALTGLRPDGSAVRLTGNELSALRPAADRSELLVTVLEWPIHGNGHVAGFTEVGEQRSWIPAAAIGWLADHAPDPARGPADARIGVALRDGARFLLSRPEDGARCSAESVERAASAAGVRTGVPCGWLADLISDLLSPGLHAERS